MKTVSILQYDHEGHQFYPSFVIKDDLQDNDNECAFDEIVINPSDEWMEDYLQWNRFGRLPDDPAEDRLFSIDDEDVSAAIPVFPSLQELHDFNTKGQELTQRLQAELGRGNASKKCGVRVAPFKPLYWNVAVGPLAAWWHVKDCNYGFIVPVQRLPVSDQLKSRLQTFRFHKGMGMWQNEDTMHQLIQEGEDLQRDLLQELHHGILAGGEENEDEHSLHNSRDDSEELALESDYTRIPESPKPTKFPPNITINKLEVHVC